MNEYLKMFLIVLGTEIFILAVIFIPEIPEWLFNKGMRK